LTPIIFEPQRLAVLSRCWCFCIDRRLNCSAASAHERDLRGSKRIDPRAVLTAINIWRLLKTAAFGV
jgi:hypothetical protein